MVLPKKEGRGGVGVEDSCRVKKNLLKLAYPVKHEKNIPVLPRVYPTLKYPDVLTGM